MPEVYDFSGWATKNDLLCADGRTIRHNAFSKDSGKRVPLVWMHNHDDPEYVLGHADLENREDGVYARCSFNGTDRAQNAKMQVQHGDITQLSIWANNLKQTSTGDVLHGVIREVSLVLSGANPGARIDFPILEHSGETVEDECILFTGEDIELMHSEEDTISHAEEEKKEVAAKTMEDVYNTLNDEQKTLVDYMVGAALGESDTDTDTDDDEDENDDDEVEHYDEGGEDFMKYNVFDGDDMNTSDVLTHGDMEMIFSNAKKLGSLREAIHDFQDENGVIMHSIDKTGMDTATGTQTYGFNDVDMLFPDFKSLNNPPEWLSRNMDWVSVVMNGVHHTPFTRIKSVYADITEDEARAKGYIKGKQKKEEVFTTLKRTTTPQTIYKKQKMDRDDIIDITDFDVVAWIRAEMRVMLNEEIARAILIGDGRPADSDDKIQEQNIRPIVTDVPLFNVKVPVTPSTKSGDEGLGETAKNTINAVIRARKEYKGSGNPTFFTTEDVLTEMLLLEDGIGHKLYKTEAEVATALRVSKIVTVEVMENQTVTVDSKNYPLIGVIVNLNDYNVGVDKGGEISMFDDFDIDYNQYKYLIETRMSGALVKPFSALTVYQNKEVAAG